MATNEGFKAAREYPLWDAIFGRRSRRVAAGASFRSGSLSFQSKLEPEPPFLDDKVVGLISAAGGTHGLQAINTMEFVTRALRAWAVPYVVPVASAARVFNEAGQIQDRSVESQLRMLGSEVVRVAERFSADDSLHRAIECQHAAERAAAAA